MESPFLPLTFIAGPAILMNACAIMQNVATARYSLAIPQWREFRSVPLNENAKLTILYSDPIAAVHLAERRLNLLIVGLNLLNLAFSLFGLTTFLGLAGALIFSIQNSFTSVGVWAIVAVSAVALALLLASSVIFIMESSCARRMMRLHPPLTVPCAHGREPQSHPSRSVEE